MRRLRCASVGPASGSAAAQKPVEQPCARSRRAAASRGTARLRRRELDRHGHRNSATSGCATRVPVGNGLHVHRHERRRGTFAVVRRHRSELQKGAPKRRAPTASRSRAAPEPARREDDRQKCPARHRARRNAQLLDGQRGAERLRPPSPTNGCATWVAAKTVLESTTSTYKVRAEDEGHSLTCRVTATNVAGQRVSDSRAPCASPARSPKSARRRKCWGSNPAAFGESLTCSPGTWNGAPAPTFAYLLGARPRTAETRP